MNITYNGSPVKHILYNGRLIDKLTYNGNEWTDNTGELTISSGDNNWKHLYLSSINVKIFVTVNSKKIYIVNR